MTRLKIKKVDNGRFYLINFTDKTMTGYYGLSGLRKLLTRINAPSNISTSLENRTLDVLIEF